MEIGVLQHEGPYIRKRYIQLRIAYKFHCTYQLQTIICDSLESFAGKDFEV